MENGQFFPEELQRRVREAFYFPEDGRLFFDNAGGSLRLKKCVEAKAQAEYQPDCPERTHPAALALKALEQAGSREILEYIFGNEQGTLMTELTASQTMFQLVGAILENVPGTNAVVSALEHPSAFDAVAHYCEKTGKQLRVIPADPQTGGILPEAAAALIDENTCLLSVMSASNVTGRIMDLEEIIRQARAIRPDLYIISDAVQHAPHAAIHAGAFGLDGVNFAPYKFFGVRGCGFACLSARAAALPHHKLLGKPQTVWELGTSAPGNFAAAREIITYVCGIGAYFLGDAPKKTLYAEGMRRIHLQERALLHRLLEGTPQTPGLRHIPGVRVYADDRDLTQRDLIAAIRIDGLDIAQCVAEYGKRGVTVCDRVSTSIYASRILQALGIDGAVRVSPLHCHSAEDIDRFNCITREIAEHLSTGGKKNVENF